MKKLLEGNEILGITNFQEPIKGVQDKKEQICSWAQNLIEKAQLSFSE